jgi:hypothetical protein
MEMLDSARSPGILRVQDRLNQTRDQIEAHGAAGEPAAPGRPVLLTVRRPLSRRPGTEARRRAAPVGGPDASLEAPALLGVALLVGAAFGWWMLPLLAVALWGPAACCEPRGAGRAAARDVVTPRRARPSVGVVRPLRQDEGGPGARHATI